MKQKIEQLLTRENFVAYLRTEPPDAPVHYFLNYDCAIARFLKHNGVPVQEGGICVTGDLVGPDEGEQVPIPMDIREPLLKYNQSRRTPRTVGNPLSFYDYCGGEYAHSAEAAIKSAENDY